MTWLLWRWEVFRDWHYISWGACNSFLQKAGYLLQFLNEHGTRNIPAKGFKIISENYVLGYLCRSHWIWGVYSQLLGENLLIVNTYKATHEDFYSEAAPALINWSQSVKNEQSSDIISLKSHRRQGSAQTDTGVDLSKILGANQYWWKDRRFLKG